MQKCLKLLGISIVKSMSFVFISIVQEDRGTSTDVFSMIKSMHG